MIIFRILFWMTIAGMLSSVIMMIIIGFKLNEENKNEESKVEKAGQICLLITVIIYFVMGLSAIILAIEGITPTLF